MATNTTIANFQYIMDKYIRVDMFKDQYNNIAPQPVINEEHSISLNSFNECIVSMVCIAEPLSTITVKNKLNPLSSVIPSFIDYVKVTVMPTSANQFYFDADKNCLYFYRTQDKQDILVSYSAIGKAMLSANLVYSEFDSNGTILKTLGEKVKESQTALDQIITVGNAESLRIKLENQINSMITIFNSIREDVPEATLINTKLETNIPLGNTTVTNLDTAIANAQGDINTINLANNQLFTVQANQLIYNETSKLYEYTLVHNLNIDKSKLVIQLTDSEGYALLDMCKRIDNNTLLVRNDEQCVINITINKGYWGGQ